MITKAEIEQFYEALNSLTIKFPGKTIAEKTGYSRGTVSDYMNRKLTPSEEFIAAFYAAFPNSKKVRKEADTASAPEQANAGSQTLSLTDQLMKIMINVIEQQNAILKENKELLVDKVQHISMTVETLKKNHDTVIVTIEAHSGALSGKLEVIEKSVVERFEALQQLVQDVDNKVYLHEFPKKSKSGPAGKGGRSDKQG